MYIMLLDRDRNAPFDLYADNQKPGLIKEEDNKKLLDLSWENVAIKNYCMAINTQHNIELDKIPNVTEYQVHARNTSSLYLNKIAILINNLYSHAWDFCNSFTVRQTTLNQLAITISKQDSLDSFKEHIAKLLEKIYAISTPIKDAEELLKNFKRRVGVDTRNFKTLTNAADNLIKNHEFEIKKLEDEIEIITIRLNYLNKAIPGYASMTGLGSLAIILAVVIAKVFIVAATGGAALPAVVGAGIGLVAGGAMVGLGSAKLYDFIEEKKEKNKALCDKSKILAGLNAEKTIATTIKTQFDPWIKNSISILNQIQTLHEEWNSIGQKFETLVRQLNDSREKKGEVLIKQLDETSNTVKNIQSTIKKHEQIKLIKTHFISEEEDEQYFLTNTKLPHYFVNPSNKIISLPTDLALAFLEKNHNL